MALVTDSSVNLGGEPVARAGTRTLKASSFIIGVEIAERLAYAGISGNLVTYLTEVMHERTAAAATNVNIWSGIAGLLPFLGAFIADSYLGRYWTILWASFVYLLGLGLVTLSAALKSLRPPPCSSDADVCPEASAFKIGFFFAALYLVALGQGGHKSCLQAFGADQFNIWDAKEKLQKSSFFNWWYFGISIGTVSGVTVLMYIQDNLGWVLGFGIPAIVMAVALCIFVGGTRFYRHKPPGGSPLTRILHVFVALYHKWGVSPSSNSFTDNHHVRANKFKFLLKATIPDKLDNECTSGFNWRLCTLEQVEEVKAVLCLFPIWASCLTFGVVFSQSATLFTKQGRTMDRRIGSSFEIPPASLQCFIAFSIISLIPVYDKIFVPVARSMTGLERGITILQRIGTGMFISVISMVVSALVEMKRIQTAQQHHLTDMPNAVIPLSVFLLLPQYVLFGIADVFTIVGLQEFFYDEMPDKIKSLGIAISFSVQGIGSILSGVTISLVEKLSCHNQKSSCWISDNLNNGHLNYFYWFLAVLSVLNLLIYQLLARKYEYLRLLDDSAYEEAPEP